MERKLTLATGKPMFACLEWDSRLRGFVLGWCAETEVANVLWIRLITISFRWPPVRFYESFMCEEEDNAPSRI